ncbi:hypothetical protein DL93DRAFT_542163 [Clavulina sp. PMI_390]|nr:hypothetical protein DL93DRAFT_542163 [Clavulina sp. PMI_390]
MTGYRQSSIQASQRQRLKSRDRASWPLEDTSLDLLFIFTHRLLFNVRLCPSHTRLLAVKSRSRQHAEQLIRSGEIPPGGGSSLINRRFVRNAEVSSCYISPHHSSDLLHIRAPSPTFHVCHPSVTILSPFAEMAPVLAAYRPLHLYESRRCGKPILREARKTAIK